jgi:hypothetical protein
MIANAAIAPASLQIACMIRLLDGRVAGIIDSQPARVLKILRQVKICHTPSRVSREAVAAAKSRRLRYSLALLAMSGGGSR